MVTREGVKFSGDKRKRFQKDATNDFLATPTNLPFVTTPASRCHCFRPCRIRYTSLHCTAPQRRKSPPPARMSRQQDRPRRAPWQNVERHYCAVCNSWMGSDRQSILLHENGKKHQESVERALQEKRRQRSEDSQAEAFLAGSLRQMEEAAAAAMQGPGGIAGASAAGSGDDTGVGGRRLAAAAAPAAVASSWQARPWHHQPPPPPPPPQQQQHQQQQQYAMPQAAPSSNFVPPPPPPAPPPRTQSQNQQHHQQQQGLAATNDRQERREWQARRQQRDEETKKRKVAAEDGDDDDNDDDACSPAAGGSGRTKRRRIRPGEGHYQVPGLGRGEDIGAATARTYLEGDVFYGVLQEDVPVQLWLGPPLATREERRLLDRDHLWRDALVLAVQQKRVQPAAAATDDDDGGRGSGSGSGRPEVDAWTVHVTYLQSPDDEEETIEKNVPVGRIRIRLGGDDASLPDTLEEARLLAVGGEEEIVGGGKSKSESSGGGLGGAVDEATGLSGWSTVSIKKTTVRQQHREEKERIVEQRRQARLEREAEAKKSEARRMEEAKVSNADDSALGAFDVWGKGDYKGVDISKDVALSVEETAKRLSGTAAGNGGKVAFRKAKNRKAPGAASRRRTSADDD